MGTTRHRRWVGIVTDLTQTTLQNLVFNMPNATDADTATHVGIFMENGSGGFVSGMSLLMTLDTTNNY